MQIFEQDEDLKKVCLETVTCACVHVCACRDSVYMNERKKRHEERHEMGDFEQIIV